MTINIDQLAAELLGTCTPLASALNNRGFDEDDMTLEQCRQLDAQVMLCDACGWWVDADEISEDQICCECS